MAGYILSIDQGTTNSKALLFDYDGSIVGSAKREFRQLYTEQGYIEHDSVEILQSVLKVLRQVCLTSKIDLNKIKALGITNQRETTVLWDKKTGEAIYNCIVWGCRRSAYICEKFKQEGYEPLIKRKTGLTLDAYFSATKIKWLLDHVPAAKEKAQKGELAFGTIDSWLLYNLSEEKAHLTDYSNASRTMLFNIHEKKWDQELLNLFEIPLSMMAEVRQTSSYFGSLKKEILGVSIPITALVGDQQAACFGQACFDEGMVKNTYGTGCFMLMNTGSEAITSTNNLLTTIAWSFEDQVTYALEGSIFVAGGVIKWLRDEMKLIDQASDSEWFAQKVTDNGGVFFVPCFMGLGAPYWDMYARGIIVGLKRDSNKNHIIRAALEAIAYQTQDVLLAMKKDSLQTINKLRCDGGVSNNNFLMQFQADITGLLVQRGAIVETTALGAAFFAGLAVNFWSGLSQLQSIWQTGTSFEPQLSALAGKELYQQWQKAVEKAKGWER